MEKPCKKEYCRLLLADRITCAECIDEEYYRTILQVEDKIAVLKDSWRIFNEWMKALTAKELPVGMGFRVFNSWQIIGMFLDEILEIRKFSKDENVSWDDAMTIFAAGKLDEKIDKEKLN